MEPWTQLGASSSPMASRRCRTCSSSVARGSQVRVLRWSPEWAPTHRRSPRAQSQSWSSSAQIPSAAGAMTIGDLRGLASLKAGADHGDMIRPRLYLLRHGETDWNAEGRLLSFTDQPLNDRGERQAARLAEDLAGICWDRAVSSPLVRARRTAEVVLAARKDAPPLSLDERLREMDFGPYEGWSESELEAD